jgi:GNAT superfamily N-acetyltransferase
MPAPQVPRCTRWWSTGYGLLCHDHGLQEGAMSRIREPTPADASELGAIHVAAWQHAYRGGLMPDDHLDRLRVDDRARWWAEGLQRPVRPRAARLVAEVDGRIVGFVLVGPADGRVDAQEGEVYALNVAPDAWGAGHGGDLLGSGVAALTDAGFARAVLWVHPGNHRARSFYEREGWRPDGAERQQEGCMASPFRRSAVDVVSALPR